MTTKQTVLIAITCPADAAIVRSALTSQYTLLEAASAGQALEILRRAQTPVTAVVLDDRDLLQQLQADAQLCALPVLVITTLGNGEQALACGAADFLYKPFAAQSLLQRLSHVISAHAWEQRTQQTKLYLQAFLSRSVFSYEFDLDTEQARLLYADETQIERFYPWIDYAYFASHPLLIHPVDLPMLAEQWSLPRLRAAFRAGTDSPSLQVRFLLQDDEWIWVDLSIHRIPHDNSTARGIVCCNAMDGPKQQDESLRRRAAYDAVSGLYNRATSEILMAQALRHYHPDRVSAFLMIDIDNFKTVNDKFGHLSGDTLLLNVGKTLRACCRKSDIIGRLGGDEFAILLCDMPGDSAVTQKTEQMLQNIASLQQQLTLRAPITISIGTTVVRPSDCALSDLVGRADVALYRAKGQGKNCCVQYEAIAPQA